MYTSMFRKAMLGDTATLNLDFTTGVLDSRLTFTRAAGTATYVNSSGYVTTASTNQPRFDYDPVTLAPRGLLIEGSATNLLNWSETLATTGGTNNNWADTNLTRTSTTNTSPRNDATALRITASAGNGTIISSAAIGTSASRTLSVWLRRVTGTGDIQYTLNNGTNWTTQIITSSWVRYSFTATTADQRVGFRIVTSGDAIELWGATLEAGSGASSYIFTDASQGTRNSDICYMSGTNFSSWWNQSEGTAFIETVGMTKPTDLSSRVFTISEYLGVPYQIGATWIYDNSGFRIADSASSATKHAVALKANDFAISNGSAAIRTGTGVLGSTYNRLQLGSYENESSLSYMNGCIKRFKYFPTRLTNAQLQTLTAP